MMYSQYPHDTETGQNRGREKEEKNQPPRSKGPRGACCGKPAGVRAPGRAGPDRGCPRRPPPPTPAPGPACTASALPRSPPPGAGRGAEGSEASISDPRLLRDEAAGAARLCQPRLCRYRSGGLLRGRAPESSSAYLQPGHRSRGGLWDPGAKNHI